MFKSLVATSIVLLGALTIGATNANAQYSSYETRIGNSTFGNVTDYNGNTLNYNTNSIGNSTFYNGYDSNGNSYSGSCSTIGNSTFCN